MADQLHGTVHVIFTVPVVVEVDTQSRRVGRVIVIDEEVQIDDNGEHSIEEWWDGGEDDTRELAEEEKADLIRRAKEISDDQNTAWPGWEFGW